MSHLFDNPFMVLFDIYYYYIEKIDRVHALKFIFFVCFTEQSKSYS